MTGLIYVILIAVWAVVLVPRFLRHHDESRRMRESERLEAALAPSAVEHEVVGTSDDRASSWSEYLLSLTNISNANWVGQMRSPRSAAAKRRRSITLGLGGFSLLSVTGAALGILPGFIAVLPALLLIGYLAAMFALMRRSESESGVSAATQASAERRTTQTRRSYAQASDGVRIVGQPAETGDGWSPRETTLPTYVSKPKASKVPRRIDLTREGWTGAGMVEAAQQQQGSPELEDQIARELSVVSPPEDQEVVEYAYPDVEDDGYYRRAVNE